MMPDFHPGQELLMDYAAGSQREPVALLVATHLTMCSSCQAEVTRLESLGGAMLETLEPEAMPDEALDHALARLESSDRTEPGPAPEPPAGDPRLPRPLRDYLGGSLDGAAWRRRGVFAELALLEDAPGFKTRLLRIKGGSTLPQHTHEGTELTLVLAGGFRDAGGHYRPGDVAQADAAVDHQPVADPGEDCLCLAVTDAPLRLTGTFGRYLNFLTHY